MHTSTLGTEPPKINPPLQAELFPITEPPDPTTPKTTSPINRLTQDPGGGIGTTAEQTGHQQIETILGNY